MFKMLLRSCYKCQVHWDIVVLSKMLTWFIISVCFVQLAYSPYFYTLLPWTSFTGTFKLFFIKRLNLRHFILYTVHVSLAIFQDEEIKIC